MEFIGTASHCVILCGSDQGGEKHVKSVAFALRCHRLTSQRKSCVSEAKLTQSHWIIPHRTLQTERHAFHV